MNLKNSILSSNSKSLIEMVKNYETDLEILYIYDRYMKSLLSELMYLKNEKLKSKLRLEFDSLIVKCERDAQEIKELLTHY